MKLVVLAVSGKQKQYGLAAGHGPREKAAFQEFFLLFLWLYYKLGQ
jgi:hypothetical protein